MIKTNIIMKMNQYLLQLRFFLFQTLTETKKTAMFIASPEIQP